MRVCAATTPLHRLLELDRRQQPNRRVCKLQHRPFAICGLFGTFSEQDLQHVLDRFSAAWGKAGMKIITEKTEGLCLSRNPRQCTLRVSGNTLKQVRFK